MLQIAFWFSFVDADDDVVNAAAAAAAAAANKIVIKLPNVLRYGYLA